MQLSTISLSEQDVFGTGEDLKLLKRVFGADAEIYIVILKALRTIHEVCHQTTVIRCNTKTVPSYKIFPGFGKISLDDTYTLSMV